MRRKKMSFVVQDRRRNKINLVQWQSTRRTLAEAWDDCLAWLAKRDKRARQESDLIMHGQTDWDDPADWDLFDPRYEKIGVLEGLAHWLDEAQPLRRALPGEVKEMEKII